MALIVYFYKKEFFMIVKELISDKIIPVKPDDMVRLAIHMMEDNKVSHLPVVMAGRYVGLLSENNLYSVGDDTLKVSDLSQDRKSVV